MIEHKSGLIITKRGEHPKKYDGDAMYVVWRGTKEIVTASYLPTLISWLDKRYRPNQFSKSKARIK